MSTQTETELTSGAQSLADFQRVVQQQEGIWGSLCALGKTGNNNTMTFQVGPSPENRACLETFTGDAAQDKDGCDLICTGDCLVKSRPEKVVAYRKKS